MRTIPANQFAVVRDRERNLIVDSGAFDACVDSARAFNEIYQSSAYTAERWEEKL